MWCKDERNPCSSPADLFSAHVKQDVGGCQAKRHAVDQQGAGVRDQGDSLQSTKTKVWQSKDGHSRLSDPVVMTQIPHKVFVCLTWA